MKKVCFVSPKSYPYFNPTISSVVGGGERQMFLLSTLLAKDKKHEVHMCVSDYGQEKKEMRKNVTIWNVFSFQDSRWKILTSLYKNFRSIFADFYVLRSASIGTAITFLILRFLLRRKVIYMVASDYENSYFTLRKKLGTFSAFLMQFVYMFSFSLSVQTEYQYSFFKKRRSDAVLLRNIIDISSLQYTKDDFDKRAYSAIWVGRCEEFKQPEFFITLADSCPKERFLMICPPAFGNESYWERVSQKANKKKNIDFHKFVSPDEISLLYRASKIYVSTSLYEGFSNTMMEAFSAGCPFLSLSVNPDGIIEKYNLGKYTSSDFDSFILEFKKFSSSSKTPYLLGKNAQKYLYDHHSPTTIFPLFLSLFRS